jgi:hypothetical protein
MQYNIWYIIYVYYSKIKYIVYHISLGYIKSYHVVSSTAPPPRRGCFGAFAQAHGLLWLPLLVVELLGSQGPIYRWFNGDCCCVSYPLVIQHSIWKWPFIYIWERESSFTYSSNTVFFPGYVELPGGFIILKKKQTA